MLKCKETNNILFFLWWLLWTYLGKRNIKILIKEASLIPCSAASLNRHWAWVLDNLVFIIEAVGSKPFGNSSTYIVSYDKPCCHLFFTFPQFLFLKYVLLWTKSNIYRGRENSQCNLIAIIASKSHVTKVN